MSDKIDPESLLESLGNIYNTPRDELVEIADTCWKHLPQDHPKRFSYATTIAGALHNQYTNTDENDFNQRALEYLQQVLDLMSQATRADQARYGEVCAKCFLAQGIRFGSEEDLDEAIECAEGSVMLTDEEMEDDHVALLLERRSTWSSCYLAKWFESTDKLLDYLKQAGEIAEKGIKMAQAGNVPIVKQIPVLHNYAMAQTVMFDETGEWRYLASALETSEKDHTALAGLPSDARHEWEANHAFRLLRAYKHVLDTRIDSNDKFLCRGHMLREEAIEAITQALKISIERPFSKLENSLTFVYYIEKLQSEEQSQTLAGCANFLKEAVSILVDIALLSTRPNRRKLLSTFYGLSRYTAAACCAAARDPIEALDVLERGRGVALSLQSSSGEFDQLFGVRKADGDFNKRFQQARKELDEAVATGQPYYLRARLFDSFKAIQAEGTAKGLLDPDAGISREQALQLASEGDIVVVNITSIRSDAIIVSKTKIRTLHLPLVDEEALSESSWVIQQALAHDVDDPLEFRRLWAALSDMLARLWRQIARPVLSELGYTRPFSQQHDQWPRIWWVPTGVLCLYPLHAAGLGLHTTKNVINRVISSYASTLGALARLRSCAEVAKRHSALAKSDDVKAVVVAMHHTPLHASLDFVKDEIEVIQSCFPHAEVLDEPRGIDVLHSMESTQIRFYHLSCHGEVDFEDPSQSRLLLTDWETRPLTVNLLRDRMLVTDRTAFLSACYTAHAGVEMEQDECDNLVNALQVAGFCGVIGSLWSVREQSALELVRDFYHHIKHSMQVFETRLNKEALHFATLALAKASCNAGNESQGNPLLWAPFVYFGI